MNDIVKITQRGRWFELIGGLPCQPLLKIKDEFTTTSPLLGIRSPRYSSMDVPVMETIYMRVSANAREVDGFCHALNCLAVLCLPALLISGLF